MLIECMFKNMIFDHMLIDNCCMCLECSYCILVGRKDLLTKFYSPHVSLFLLKNNFRSCSLKLFVGKTFKRANVLARLDNNTLSCLCSETGIIHILIVTYIDKYIGQYLCTFLSQQPNIYIK